MLADTIKSLHPRSLKHLSSGLSKLVEGRLWLKVLIAMFAGMLVGILLGPSVGWVEPATGALIGNWLLSWSAIFSSDTDDRDPLSIRIDYSWSCRQ